MSGAAIKPVRRPMTARELGERFGRSPRTVRRVIAEPRDELNARAKTRQLEALALRAKGLTYGQIAKELGISRDSAAGLVRRALTHQQAESVA